VAASVASGLKYEVVDLTDSTLTADCGVHSRTVRAETGSQYLGIHVALLLRQRDQLLARYGIALQRLCHPLE
jgi:hypothetical protein